jgi:hypothetical protein
MPFTHRPSHLINLESPVVPGTTNLYTVPEDDDDFDFDSKDLVTWKCNDRLIDRDEILIFRSYEKEGGGRHTTKIPKLTFSSRYLQRGCNQTLMIWSQKTKTQYMVKVDFGYREGGCASFGIVG